jgi:hypothetical protein
MQNNEKELSLVDIYINMKVSIKFLWHNKNKIILVAIISGIIGLFVSLLIPVKYEAKVTFIAEQSAGGNGLGAIASSFGFGSFGENEGLFENQTNLINYIQSRSIIEEAYLNIVPGTNQSFAERFIQAYQWNNDWEEDEILKDIDFSPPIDRSHFKLCEDSVLNEIFVFTVKNKLLNVSIPDKMGSLIDVKYTTVDDTLSRYYPEVLVNIVSQKYIEAKTKILRESINVLELKTDSVREKLYEALYSVASETDQSFSLNPAMNVRRVEIAKNQVDVNASTIVLEQLVKNLELTKIQLLNQTPLIQVIDAPRFPLEEVQYRKIVVIILFGFFFTSLYVVWLLLQRALKVEFDKRQIKNVKL